MLDEVTAIRRRFDRARLAGRLYRRGVRGDASGLGFDALIYDYTPVPYDLDGDDHDPVDAEAAQHRR